MQYLVASLIGLVSGITSGLFGVGGGIVMVPAMVYLMKLDTKLAVGTSLAVIVPTAVMGVWKHQNLGNLNWPVALSLMPTALVGGYLGARLTELVSSADLKRIFGGFIVLVGLRLLLFK